MKKFGTKFVDIIIVMRDETLLCSAFGDDDVMVVAVRLDRMMNFFLERCRDVDCLMTRAETITVITVRTTNDLMRYHFGDFLILLVLVVLVVALITEGRLLPSAVVVVVAWSGCGGGDDNNDMRE